MSLKFQFVKVDMSQAIDVVIDRNSDIVRYGSDNMAPQKLLELSTQSALHTAILSRKTKMGVGEGFYYNAEENAKTDLFMKHPNPYESLDDILLKCYTDLEIFGGFSLNVVWSKNKNSIAELYHRPFQNFRSPKADKNGMVDFYYYYDNWKKYTRYNDVEIFSRFADKNKAKPQVLYAKKYSSENIYYPIPSYVGGLADINTLHQISTFHNSCISNNFQPGLMILYKGPRPDAEKQDAIVAALEEKYQGSDKAGTPGIFFLENDEEINLEQTQVSDLDKQYTTITEGIKENVVLAHEIPRIVAGLEKSGSLGGSKEIVEARQVFYNDYVKLNQNFLLKQFNQIMDINGLEQLEIKNSSPSLFLYSESLLSQILTKNEIRNMFGFDDLEDGLNEEGDEVIDEDVDKKIIDKDGE